MTKSTNPNPKVKTFVKSIVFTDPANQMALEIMEIKGLLSFSQAVRDAIFEYHKKIKPAYLDLTPAGEMKQEKIVKERILKNIPDKEFAEKYLEDISFYTDSNNVEWVLFRKVGNYVGAVMLSDIKQWIKNKNPEYNYHIQVAKQGHASYESALEDKLIRQTLAEQYGVAITVE